VSTITVDQVISSLGLRPLEREGGYYVETYRSEAVLPAGVPEGRVGGRRPLATAIYYLLTPDTYSALHRLPADEMYHFYLGAAVEMLQLWPDGSARRVILGPDIAAGMKPQVVVPAGVWQGSRLAPGGRLALVGTTMSPGFDMSDYEPGRTNLLASRYPQVSDLIRVLSPG
jgi:predicted cupin superfamily sugar epimerase